MKLTIEEIVAATGALCDIHAGRGLTGSPLAPGSAMPKDKIPFWPGTVATSAVADSRKAGPGSLFCCLPGSRADGHEFASTAVQQGAVAVLAAKALPEIRDRAAVLVVPDVLKALGKLARFWRERCQATVVALSGSAGKSTVKEFLASILAQMGKTIKNPGNYNNQLGLPLSMLAADLSDQFWVLELGISRKGDMEELAAMCEPDLAVVHNIGPAHLEGLGDLAGVAHAKAALFGFVRKNGAAGAAGATGAAVLKNGVAIANRDYPLLWEAAQKANVNVMPMSTTATDVPFHGHFVGLTAEGLGRYRLSFRETPMDVVLPCQGAHLAENILAAAAAAAMLGATPDQIRAGLAQAATLPGRFTVMRAGRLTVIDDTYNANPLSMRASIEAAQKLAQTLAQTPAPKLTQEPAPKSAPSAPLMLVLGEMGELGQHAESAHEELGRMVAHSGCRTLFFKGEHAAQVEQGLKHEGFAGEFRQVKSADDFTALLKNLDIPEGVVLFKGSRKAGMEEFLEAWLAEHGGAR